MGEKTDMRRNQVSIFIERFGKYVPKDYPNYIQRISVYCDDGASIYAALAKANAMAVNELNEYETIGARSYVSSNAYAKYDYREMNGVEPKDKSNYDDDLELEFTYKSDKLRSERIWVYENLDEILGVIQAAANKNDLIFNLKDKFGLDDLQVRKILSVRLDMLTKKKYLDDVAEREEFEERKNSHTGWDKKVWIRHWQYRIREEERKIKEYNACIVMAENYPDIIQIISENPNLNDYENILEEKYGFDRGQSELVKLMSVNDFFSVDVYREKVKRAESEIEQYQKWIDES